MVMLGNNSTRRASSRSARLSSSISHTISTHRQRPTGKVRRSEHLSPLRKKSTKSSRKVSSKSASPLQSFLKKRRRSNRLRLEPKKLSAPEYSLLGILAVSCLCIVASFLTVASFDPARDAEGAMSDLASAYYIEFLYPRTLGSHINDPAPILSKYTETGLPSVRLSHLLLYNDGAHASYANYFNNKYYKCDTSRSYFSFYPVAPYGPRDYTVEYSPDCEKVL